MEWEWEGGDEIVGEMEANPKTNSPPNRNWPNHHREFFAFGKEKRVEELCVRKERRYKHPTTINRPTGKGQKMGTNQKWH